jgi:hypothetical protein
VVVVDAVVQQGAALLQGRLWNGPAGSVVQGTITWCRNTTSDPLGCRKQLQQSAAHSHQGQVQHHPAAHTPRAACSAGVATSRLLQALQDAS